MQIKRFDNNPIITQDMDSRIGDNVNGPSLIRVPDWLADPLGRYYLYFAHHGGDYIRLAFADRLEGPWRMHTQGTLRLDQTPCTTHIASPDVHVDRDARQIRMYYHGSARDVEPQGIVGSQRSFAAVSADGLNFEPVGQVVGHSYARAFRWQDWWYFLTMPGIFVRSRDGLTDFQPGPTLFTGAMRHSAVRLVGDTLEVYYTNAGDRPERILLSTINLTEDWRTWQATDPVTVLKPERDYEGANLPLVASERGRARQPVHQLRDPCILQKDARTYLLYSTAGEQAIAIAEILK